MIVQKAVDQSRADDYPVRIGTDLGGLLGGRNSDAHAYIRSAGLSDPSDQVLSRIGHAGSFAGHAHP